MQYKTAPFCAAASLGLVMFGAVHIPFQQSTQKQSLPALQVEVLRPSDL